MSKIGIANITKAVKDIDKYTLPISKELYISLPKIGLKTQN